MTKIEEKAIREIDGAGHLVAAGYQWSEPRLMMRFWSAFLIWIGFSIPFASFLTEGLTAAKFNGFIASFIIGTGMVVAGFVMWRFNSRPRAVIFESSGHILLPFGVPRYEHFRSYNAHLDTVTSCEAVPNGVYMYFKNGDIGCVSARIEDFVAHKVAVQLQTALKDIRSATGSLHKQAAASEPIN